MEMCLCLCACECVGLCGLLVSLAEHVSMGLAIMQTAWGILGSVPGPILLGRIIDTSCTLEQQSCSSDGYSCVLSDNGPAAVKYALYAVACKVGATVFYYLSMRSYKRSQANAGLLTPILRVSPEAVQCELTDSRSSSTLLDGGTAGNIKLLSSER